MAKAKNFSERNQSARKETIRWVGTRPMTMEYPGYLDD
ncbi:uncharacterized protein METZ01_LOCUS356480, partial [marine metagenome]